MPGGAHGWLLCIVHAVSGGDTVATVDERASTDERVATARPTSLDLGVPRPRVRLGLDAADDAEEDVGLDAGDAALVVVRHALAVVIVVEQLHAPPDTAHPTSPHLISAERA